MEVNDIQARLNKKVAEQAQNDFKEALNQCTKLLQPFFKPVEYASDEEKVAVQTAFNVGTKISSYGNVYLCNNMDVPAAYVARKQAEASKEFIDKVEELQAQVEDLYNQVN